MLERLLARFGFYRRTWDRPSEHRDIDPVARANRWTSFYNEPGGLGEVIQGIRRAYFEQIGSLRPGDVDGLKALAMGDLIARSLDGAVKVIIETGELEKQAHEHAAKIAALSPSMRRRL